MRIGILGGSFDPPHLGHLLVARQTKEIMHLDRIWLMPYFAHSWDTTTSSAKDRFEMTKLVGEKDIIASNEEVKLPKTSYAIDTVRRLKQKYSHEFFWIIGSDAPADFKKWKESEQLTKEITFLVFPRNGYIMPIELPANFQKIASSDLITSNISSHIIRNRIIKGLSVEGLISNSVLSYIQKQNLYEKNRS